MTKAVDKIVWRGELRKQNLITKTVCKLFWARERKHNLMTRTVDNLFGVREIKEAISND